MLEADFVIIGSGSAGSAMAYRLSDDGKHSVIVIEFGGTDMGPLIQMPSALSIPLNMSLYDWGFASEPEPHLGGRVLATPRGKVIGGSSSINGMVYVRGQPQDYDVWRQLGNAGWSWTDVLPYFKKSEDFIHGADELHGSGGELRVEEARVDWEVLDAFRDACEQVGIPKTKDYNAGKYEGSAYFQVTQKKGVRWSTATAFLKPAKDRSNLRVVTGAQTARVQLDGRRVTGVEFWQDGVLHSAQSNVEVILSAGAIGSPQIMQASGLGPAALLREHGVDVQFDIPGVGENLQDHCQPRQMFRVRDTITLNEKANSLFGRIGMGLQYILSRTGPLAIGPATLTVFTKSDPTFETPNIQYHVVPATYPKLGEPPSPFPGFTASACNLRPSSRGWVRIKNADARQNPSIRYNYLATPEDQQVAIDSIKLTRRIVAAPALARFGAEEFMPGLQAQTDAELLDAAREYAGTVYHPVGTCKMGQDRMAVVDERLRVRGLDGLRVVDASIMPNLVSGNTNAPTIMIAEKASDMIKADRAAPQSVAA
jgi:choline dehydrogenase